MLSAENYDQAIKILKDCGVGAADACSINLTFVNDFDERKFYNIEMGPALGNSNESELDISTVIGGGYSIHCNHFMRLKTPENDDVYMNATKFRLETLKKFAEPKSRKDVLNMLGDQTEPHWIFRDKVGETKTICVGIFDLKKLTWSLYKGNPKTDEPLVVLPMFFKD